MVTSENIVESLARGHIPVHRSHLYLAKNKVIVYDISGRNESASTQTFNIFTNINGISIGKIPVSCQLLAGYSFDKILNNPILLNKGDSIDGDCLSSKAISFEIVGITDV